VRRFFLITVASLLVVSIGIGLLGWAYEGPRRFIHRLRTRGS
jgi:hypothetical protein